MADQDTQDEEALPAELVSLIEPLAAAVHAAWVETKKAQRWTLGPMNEQNKQHPHLVDYYDLPEEIKSLDRATARAVLLALPELGYRVSRVSDPAAGGATGPPPVPR